MDEKNLPGALQVFPPVSLSDEPRLFWLGLSIARSKVAGLPLPWLEPEIVFLIEAEEKSYLQTLITLSSSHSGVLLLFSIRLQVTEYKAPRLVDQGRALDRVTIPRWWEEEPNLAR